MYSIYENKNENSTGSVSRNFLCRIDSAAGLTVDSK